MLDAPRSRRLTVPLVLALLGSIVAAQPSARPADDPFADVARTLTGPGATTMHIEWAGRMLSRAPADRAIAIARDAVARGDWEARRQVARALAAIPGTDAAALLVTLTRDVAWSVRSDAVRSLGLRGDAATTDAAIALLDDDVWSVRWQATRTLATLPPGPSRDGALLRAVDDVERAVRSEAERALLAVPIAAANARYRAIFTRGDGDPSRRLAAARALVRTGDASTDAWLIDLAGARSPTTPILAMRALQMRGGDPLAGDVDARVRALLIAWTRETGAVRSAAEATIRHLPPDVADRIVAAVRAEPDLGEGAWLEVGDWVVGALLARDRDPFALVTEPKTPAPLRAAIVEAIARARPGPFAATAAAEYRRARRALARPDATVDLRAALIAVVHLGARPSNEPGVLALAIDDPAPVVRARAARAWLDLVIGDRPYDALGERLGKHRSNHFGSTFPNRVARRRTPVALEFLIRIAEGRFTDRAKVRLAALAGLTSIEWPAAQARRITGWLRERLAVEADPDGRIRILRLLYNLERDDAIPVIASVAASDAERLEVRLAAVTRLGYSKRASAAPTLRALASDESIPRELRDEARLHLIRLAQPEDAPTMIAALASGPARERRFALAALERIRTDTALPALRKTVADGLVATESRARALRVIAATEREAAAEALLRHLREERLPEMRVAALDALGVLAPASYTARLLHYVEALRAGRRHDERSRELFAEIVSELGRARSSRVTDFLIAFMLEDEMIPDQPPAQNRPERPLAIAARTALFGHGPLQVRRRLNAVLRERIDTGGGAGIAERFFAEFFEQCRRPARRRSWTPLAVDLAAHVVDAAPHGTRRDAHALALIAHTAFDDAAWSRAADALARLRRLALQEAHVARDDGPDAIEVDPLHRLDVRATIARALAGDDARAGAAAIRAAIDAWPHDAWATVLGAHAVARLGVDVDWAIARLDAFDDRSPDGAHARYAIATTLAGAERRDDAVAQLRAALRDHPPLARRLASDDALRDALGTETIDRLTGETRR